MSAVSLISAVNTVIAFYASRNHSVKRLVFDHEAVFRSLEGKITNVQVSCTPTGLHNRFVERAVQDLKQKKACAECDLPYILDDRLEVYSYQNAADCINLLPNERTGPTTTPYYIVHDRRPSIPSFKFGQAVVCHIRTQNNTKRIEYCIYLCHDYTNSYIVYNPLTGSVLSRNNCVRSEMYPKEWKMPARPQMMLVESPKYVPDPKYQSTVLNNSEQHVNSEPQSTQLPITDQATSTTAKVSTSIPNAQSEAAYPPSTITSSTSSLPSIAHLIPSLQSLRSAADPPIISQPSAISSTAPNIEAAPQRDISVNQTSSITPQLASNKPSSKTSQSDILSREPSTRNRIPTKRIFGGDYHTSQSNYIHVSDPVPTLHNVIPSYRISITQALRDPDPQRVESAVKAMKDEITQLIDMQTLLPVPLNKIPAQHRSRIIPSFIFFKEKTRADGTFDKWKARLVAGGHMVDTSLMGDISADVVNPVTVLLMLSVAAAKGLSLMTADVKGAFLIPELSDGPTELTYIRVDKNLSDIITEVKPQWATLRNPNGTYTMKLQKALYGLPVSANKWMTHLNQTLAKLGFTPTNGDKCCFTRGAGTDMIIICVHVDDILGIGPQTQLDRFKSEITKEYDINVEMGRKHSYIGLDINQSTRDSTITVGQGGYRREVVNRFQHLIDRCRYDGKVPAGNNILGETPVSDDELVDRTDYMSIIMSVMFLARLTRADLLFTCNVLSTHCSEPRYSHFVLAVKMLKYLAVSDDYIIVYKPGAIVPDIYADASHAIHKDGKGQGCIIAKAAGGVIFARSFKLKMITLSSTESEWIVMCEAATFAEWLKDMILLFGYAIRPIIIRQDNTSAIWLAEHGASFSRTRHLLVRRNKVKENIVSDIIKVVYTPTEFMVADMGTKPLSLRSLLMHLKHGGYKVPVMNVQGRMCNIRDIVIPVARKTQRGANSASEGNSTR